MVDFTAVTDEDLQRARRDPIFRRKLLSEHLEVLLAMLSKMRASSTPLDTDSAGRIQEGLDLAAKLADLLQTAGHENGPHRAA